MQYKAIINNIHSWKFLSGRQFPIVTVWISSQTHYLTILEAEIPKDILLG